MKRWIALLLLLSLVVMPVWGELAAPEVPEAGAKYMPKETKSFGKSPLLFALRPYNDTVSDHAFCVFPDKTDIITTAGLRLINI